MISGERTELGDDSNEYNNVMHAGEPMSQGLCNKRAESGEYIYHQRISVHTRGRKTTLAVKIYAIVSTCTRGWAVVRILTHAMLLQKSIGYSSIPGAAKTSSESPLICVTDRSLSSGSRFRGRDWVKRM